MTQIGLAIVAASIVGLLVGGTLIGVSATHKDETNPAAAAAATAAAGGATSQPARATATAAAEASDLAAAGDRFRQMEAAMATAEAGSTRFPEVVARVNGVEIPGRDLAARMAMIEAAPPGPEPTPTVQEALDALIRDELWYQEAAARGLLCSEDEAKQAYAAILGRVDPDTLSRMAQSSGVDPRDALQDPAKLPTLQLSCAIAKARQAVLAEAGNPQAYPEFQKVLDNYIAAARQKANIEILLPP